MSDAFTTHEVFNQPPPLIDYNLFTGDRALQEAVSREGAGWAASALTAFGQTLGSAQTIEWGVEANRSSPVLHTVDRFGHRRDEVEFHPAWHALMALGVKEGLHAAAWERPQPGAQVARAAGVFMMTQIEAGVLCPLTMTSAVIPVLAAAPMIEAEWKPRLLSRRYDGRLLPAPAKTGALMGMGMTEKQGGSDLRANTTRAIPDGAAFRLIGHKWFMSAPMCDAFLVLAQAPGGLTCFFLPRFTPDDALNAIRLQRLKDKLGNRSNASSEVEFQGAYAERVGEEGRGIPTIIEMANNTRLDCVVASAGLTRQAVAQALHHAGHRTAFQKRLIDQPAMRAVLADLALESEAATALAMRLARAFDDPGEALLKRILTPAAKYWICKRGPIVAAEAMEVLGGNGYIEESPMPRLYREMPVNSIWEGSGNIMCLDFLRALTRTPDALDVIAAELALSRATAPRLDEEADTLMAALASGPHESEARYLAERLVLLVQASLLVRHAPSAVADAFCASRLGGAHGSVFGTLPRDTDTAPLLERASPTP
ncbi:MAG TPA: isovaleryl-CoA dehydrogenase [Stellaceae bacterium]|nr:isovaleryl-CoA dehydrogenase [Stellaceae bacterium]